EFRHAARGRILTLRFIEKVEGQSLRWTAVLRLAGRSLTLSIAAPGTQGSRTYTGFSLGRLAPGARELRVPGMLDPLFVLPGGRFFSGYLDRWRSFASAAPPASALYRPNTDGRILPIEETFYLT